MQNDIKITLLKAENSETENIDYSDPQLCINKLVSLNGATPMFFIIISIPRKNSKTVNNDVTVETFCDPDALPAKTIGKLLQNSTDNCDQFLCFRDPVMVKDFDGLTIRVTCGDLEATRKVSITR